MATVESINIAANEAAILRKGYSLLEKLVGDPKTGMDVKRRIQELDPQTQFPDVALADNLTKPLSEQLNAVKAEKDALASRLDAYIQERKDRDDHDALGKAIDQTKNRYNLTDEGMESVIAYMKDNQVANPAVAAAAYLHDHAPAKPITPSPFLPQSMDLFGVKGNGNDLFKQLHNDPWGYFDQTVADILNEAA